jgi:hypothetical protein
MRQGQQNRRGRNRTSNNNNNNSNNNNNLNNNRKPQNSLSRSYESSGPDVKIRGTAAQIAEKYMTLARDASSAGDTVTAENYLQHAEHYNRIIMAAQAQVQAQPQMGPAVGYQPSDNHSGLNGSHRPPMDANGAMREQPQPRIPYQQPMPQPSPQPVIPVEAADANAAPVSQNKADQPAPVDSRPVESRNDTPKDDAAAGEVDTGRRRRRRYPTGGSAASRAASTDSANANGKAADAPEDGRPSDEALA